MAWAAWKDIGEARVEGGRLNDDQAIDNDINDGENYNLSFNKYNIESELEKEMMI